MPAVGPLRIGVALTCQVSPRSPERKTRACAPPPVAEPGVATACGHNALAARGEGELAGEGRRHVGVDDLQLRPPSLVERIRKRPSTGSDRARPRWLSKNVMQS